MHAAMGLRRTGALLSLSLAIACGAYARSPDCADWRSSMERAHPESVAPEPAPPQLECNVVREVRCVPPAPVRSAWQMTPFTQCPRTIERWSRSILSGNPQFSRRETRARRLGRKQSCAPTPPEGECCYVQFSTNECD